MVFVLLRQMISSIKNDRIELIVLTRCSLFHLISNLSLNSWSSSRLACAKSVLSNSSFKGTFPKMVTNTTPIIYSADDTSTIHIMVLDEVLSKKTFAMCRKNGPKNTIINVGLIIARFISWKDRKYPISTSCPIPGVTAFVQVKQRPAVSPVKRVVSNNTKVCVSKFKEIIVTLF